MNAVLETIFRRRSIRLYEEKPVPEDLLIQLLKAAMAGPSAHNGRPWEFIVITGAATMAELRSHLRYGKHNAPAAIAVCYNPAITSSPSNQPWWVQDCAAAIENMLIAAPGLGLGAVWVGVYPKPENVQPVRRILGLPDEIIPFGLVYTGYPAEKKPSRTQFDERRVHWQTYRKPEP